MVAEKQGYKTSPQTALPNSRKVYVAGKLHPDIRVPLREISLAPTKTMSGDIEANEPVRVYDCSGPWGDPSFRGDVEEGLPAFRRDWILARGDVEEYSGREVRPVDNGYLSAAHIAQSRTGAAALSTPRSASRRPLR